MKDVPSSLGIEKERKKRDSNVKYLQTMFLRSFLSEKKKELCNEDCRSVFHSKTKRERKIKKDMIALKKKKEKAYAFEFSKFDFIFSSLIFNQSGQFCKYSRQPREILPFHLQRCH